MLIGYVSDEYYAAIPDAAVEFRGAADQRIATRSTASAAVLADLPPGEYEVALACRGFGSKRVRLQLPVAKPHHFRLLSDKLLGYAWPKWCKAGESVQFRVHSVEPYKLTLWRYGLQKQFVKNIGWYDQHGPRGVMQTVPDGFFAETGVKWDAGLGGVHGQRIVAPEQTGLYYFHAKTDSGAFFSFPLVVAPAKPRAAIAVIASTNTWNAYNSFGGRSNYILAARMIDEPIVNSKSDLPRYKLANYGEWKSAEIFEPLSFDRPEPYNHVPEDVQCTDPIEGRQACHLAPAEWRTLGWLEREKIDYDFYSEAQLHDGTLNLDAYKVLILNVHPEYWSIEMYKKVKAWVFERGGRLMYLGGNGLNCAIEYLPDQPPFTNQQQDVIRCIIAQQQRFTPEILLKDIETAKLETSRATVHRTISKLVESGKLLKVELGTDNFYIHSGNRSIDEYLTSLKHSDSLAMRCLNPWPDNKESRFHTAHESEANLLGVVFSDAGAMTSAPYEVIESTHWIFAGAGLRKGDRFGTKILHQRYGDGASGHETDKITPSTPKNAVLLAKGLNPDEGGAHLLYFETSNGGAVFSAGSITYPTGLLVDKALSKITKNVLTKLLS